MKVTVREGKIVKNINNYPDMIKIIDRILDLICFIVFISLWIFTIVNCCNFQEYAHKTLNSITFLIMNPVYIALSLKFVTSFNTESIILFKSVILLFIACLIFLSSGPFVNVHYTNYAVLSILLVWLIYKKCTTQVNTEFQINLLIGIIHLILLISMEIKIARWERLQREERERLIEQERLQREEQERLIEQERRRENRRIQALEEEIHWLKQDPMKELKEFIVESNDHLAQRITAEIMEDLINFKQQKPSKELMITQKELEEEIKIRNQKSPEDMTELELAEYKELKYRQKIINLIDSSDLIEKQAEFSKTLQTGIMDVIKDMKKLAANDIEKSLNLSKKNKYKLDRVNTKAQLIEESIDKTPQDIEIVFDNERGATGALTSAVDNYEASYKTIWDILDNIKEIIKKFNDIQKQILKEKYTEQQIETFIRNMNRILDDQILAIETITEVVEKSKKNLTLSMVC